MPWSSPLLFCVLLLLQLLLPATLLAEQERILDFQSLVQVHQDASITVTETIKVQALGRDIKRGIFRWLPTRTSEGLGLGKNVSYQVLSVQRDGKPEAYHIDDQGDKLILYLGQKSVFLNPGVYTYTIVYRSWRQIRFFEQYDEIYWNVTGSYWSFPIDKASCTVELPPGVSVLQKQAYTGRPGQQGKAFKVTQQDQGKVTFETTQIFGLGEGFTVAVSFPKGAVSEPDSRQRMLYFLQDNKPAVIAAAGFVLAFIYYLFFWFRVGKDPRRWTIVPLFEPPQNLSPAAMRYILRMGFDNKAFAAALINLAVKGHLEIEEKSGIMSKKYTLHRKQGGQKALSKGEQALLQLLFAYAQSVELSSSNSEKIRKALKKLKNTLKGEYEKVYFVTNSGLLLPGMLLSVATLVLMAFSASGAPAGGALAITIWIVGWSAGCFFLFKRWLESLKRGSVLPIVLTSAFTLPFLGGLILGLSFYAQMVSWPAAVLVLLLALTNVIFYQLLKAPTFAGRRLMDEIEGFKLFLGVAEKERLEIMHPVEQTPELFEKYLPYALALDVENSWSQKFSGILEQAGTDGRSYSPVWYHGSSWSNLGAAGFAGSLASSLTSAATSSTSSGSTGGGGVGGGGGGGGGGGW